MLHKNVTVIDYGMGNLWSVKSALDYLGASTSITADPEIVCRAEVLILPGVGSFRKAMSSLKNTGLQQAILEAVKTKGSKILGICLGMQLLGSYGTEDGETAGLGLIPNRVERFTTEEVGKNKIPHIGFNAVRRGEQSILFRGLPASADFYFVHSYRLLPQNLKGKTAISTYGIDFLAGFEVDNIYGTQFHPEKSQTNGLVLLKNFLESNA